MNAVRALRGFLDLPGLWLSRLDEISLSLPGVEPKNNIQTSFRVESEILYKFRFNGQFGGKRSPKVQLFVSRLTKNWVFIGRVEHYAVLNTSDL